MVGVVYCTVTLYPFLVFSVSVVAGLFSSVDCILARGVFKISTRKVLACMGFLFTKSSAYFLDIP